MVEMMDLYQPGRLLGFLKVLKKKKKATIASLEILRGETAIKFCSPTFSDLLV